MLITVFTPTYNRAHLLGRLYKSLCAQQFTDFEWVIVDDGSTDGTASLVQGFIAERRIDIKYLSQRNGGKHRAINHGVKLAQGELFFIVDSDDSLPMHSLEAIAHEYDAIKDDSSFGGVAGYMASHSGEEIVQQNVDNRYDCTALEIRYKYHIKGDLAEVFRTKVLKEFPFPEIANELFCPEALVWNRIAQRYRLRYFHKVIYHRDYLADGLSAKIARIRMESPIASAIHYSELNSYNIPWWQKLKAAINYWRFRLCCKKFSRVPRLPLAWNTALPLGWLMHMRDLHNS